MKREQIEKKAKEWCKQYIECDDNCRWCPNERYKDYFIEGAEWLLSHQWVSVEDELPPKGEVVIAHYETADEIGETFATHDGTNWGNGGEYFEDDAVTHWMPIPPMAEEGGIL